MLSRVWRRTTFNSGGGVGAGVNPLQSGPLEDVGVGFTLFQGNAAATWAAMLPMPNNWVRRRIEVAASCLIPSMFTTPAGLRGT
jgi:hypothetical protein